MSDDRDLVIKLREAARIGEAYNYGRGSAVVSTLVSLCKEAADELTKAAKVKKGKRP